MIINIELFQGLTWNVFILATLDINFTLGCNITYFIFQEGIFDIKNNLSINISGIPKLYVPTSWCDYWDEIVIFPQMHKKNIITV